MKEPQGKPYCKPLDCQGGEGVDSLDSPKESHTSVRLHPFVHDRAARTDKPTFTFLGLSEPFDLVCISSNIAFWKDDRGIDGQHIMDCLRKASVCLGSTLRATHVEADGKGKLL